MGLCAICEADSINSCGIRMADMLAGIISKLLKALHATLSYTSPEIRVSKKILDKSWFAVNERQLALYKKIYQVAIDLNKAWYKAFAGTYADDLIIFIALLSFMNHFESVADINNNLDMQGEYFNAYACENLSDYYKRMQTKLPIDPVIETSMDYFLNRRGAKVYFDITKQPLLNINNRRLIYEVLSVGLSKEMIPMITVQEGHETKCYRIPKELSDWALTVVGLANRGQNLFPSKVRFTKTETGCLVDIL